MIDILRRELKYGLSQREASHLESRLSYVLSEDPHNLDDGYMVRSLYFDTVTNSDYFDKEDGIDYRKKIRLRIYDTEDSTAKLELKEKQGIFQRKRSLEISRAEAQTLIAGDYGFLAEKGEFGSLLSAIMNVEFYRPVCIVQYRRKAFISETNDIRITFDTALSSNEGNFDLFDAGLQLYPVGNFSGTVMEVKYNHFLLSYIKQVLDLADKSQVSNSKYCQCRLYSLGGAL